VQAHRQGQGQGGRASTQTRSRAGGQSRHADKGKGEGKHRQGQGQWGRASTQTRLRARGGRGGGQARGQSYKDKARAGDTVLRGSGSPARDGRRVVKRAKEREWMMAECGRWTGIGGRGHRDTSTAGPTYGSRGSRSMWQCASTWGLHCSFAMRATLPMDARKDSASSTTSAALIARVPSFSNTFQDLQGGGEEGGASGQLDSAR
jgi:hypothetical protein